MTVSTTISNIVYTADGVQTVFPITYSVDSASDIVVGLDGIITTTGFTITLNANQSANPGGEVTFDTAPVNGVQVDLARQTSLTQQTDYNAYDPFPAETHERALDKLTLIAQDIDSRSAKYVRVPTATNSAGNVGDVAIDADYLYVCVALDTWKRTPLTTW